MVEKPTKQHIFVLMYPDCVEFEVMLAAELCNQNYDVRVATPTGKGHRGSNGIKIEADVAIKDIKIDECIGLLIPGGDPYELIEGECAASVRRLLLEVAERNLVQGAICAAPAILGKHGLLKSKRFTHGYGDAHKEFLAPLWEGGDFTDADLEIDGNLITAKPSAHTEFATQFAHQIGAITSAAKRDRLTRYYKNIPENQEQ